MTEDDLKLLILLYLPSAGIRSMSPYLALLFFEQDFDSEEVCEQTCSFLVLDQVYHDKPMLIALVLIFPICAQELKLELSPRSSELSALLFSLGHSEVLFSYNFPTFLTHVVAA